MTNPHAQPPTAGTDVTPALDAIFEPFNKSDAPGLVVGIAQHGRTLYRRGFGLASLEFGVANQPATRMRIGSTSKHFAALAALLLAEEGRLDLDAPARLIIPELPAEVGAPTLRQFMTHTSGLRDYLDMGLLTDGPAIKPRGTAFGIQTTHAATNFEPGAKATYNNGGYHLLAVAIDRVAGVPFEAFVRTRIFEPLGMRDTTWSSSDFDVNRGMASLYLPDMAGGWRKGMFPSEEVRAEGGMVSTIDDLLRWLAHLRSSEKQVGSEASWAQMTQPTRLSSAALVPYGLGLMLGRYRGLQIVHHGGNVFGGACQMLTVPERGLDIVIITNGALVSPVDLAEKVIDAVLADGLAPPQVKTASAPYGALLGKTYGSLTSGVVVKFADADGGIAASIFNSPAIPLVDTDDGGLQLPFEKIVAGPFEFRVGPRDAQTPEAPRTITMLDGGHAETLALLDAPPAVELLAQELTGDYDVPDLGATARIQWKDQTLELRMAGQHGHAQILLTPVSTDLCVWAFGLATLPLRGTLRIERHGGAVSAIRLDTLRTRGLRVVKRPR